MIDMMIGWILGRNSVQRKKEVYEEPVFDIEPKKEEKKIIHPVSKYSVLFTIPTDMPLSIEDAIRWYDEDKDWIHAIILKDEEYCILTEKIVDETDTVDDMGDILYDFF